MRNRIKEPLTVWLAMETFVSDAIKAQYELDSDGGWSGIKFEIERPNPTVDSGNGFAIISIQCWQCKAMLATTTTIMRGSSQSTGTIRLPAVGLQILLRPLCRSWPTTWLA